MALDTTVGGASSDSYNTLAEIAAYATARGKDFAVSPAEQAEAAARVGATWLDNHYRLQFPGYKTNGRSQSREWPRYSAFDVEGNAIDSDEIPQEILDAHCEAAIREYNSEGSLMPDVGVGGLEKRIKAGSVEIERFGPTATQPSFPEIDLILSGLIGNLSQYTARLVRA